MNNNRPQEGSEITLSLLDAAEAAKRDTYLVDFWRGGGVTEQGEEGSENKMKTRQHFYCVVQATGHFCLWSMAGMPVRSRPTSQSGGIMNLTIATMDKEQALEKFQQYKAAVL